MLSSVTLPGLPTSGFTVTVGMALARPVTGSVREELRRVTREGPCKAQVSQAAGGNAQHARVW
jgi:hypothetical protein